MRHRWLTWCWAAVAGLGAAAAAMTGFGQEAPEASPREFNPRVVVKRTFQPIVDAPVLAAAEVTDQVLDHELVLGVVVNGEPRAYPINMLTGPSREIINDTLGGRPIAATW